MMVKNITAQAAVFLADLRAMTPDQLKAYFTATDYRVLKIDEELMDAAGVRNDFRALFESVVDDKAEGIRVIEAKAAIAKLAKLPAADFFEVIAHEQTRISDLWASCERAGIEHRLVELVAEKKQEWNHAHAVQTAFQERKRVPDGAIH